LPDEELYQAHARTTHAVDILAFVEAQEIPADCFETPYTLAPAPGGEKVYDLLRETLHHSGKIGIACVVIQSRQHLAAVIPEGQSLVLNTLRWARECEVHEDAGVMDDDHALDLAMARRMAMMAPSAHNGGYAGAGLRNPFQPDEALEENIMKVKKSERLIVEELEGLLEDDDLIDDDYLASVLGRRLHLPNSDAMRRGQTPRRFRHVQARRRRG